MIPALYTHLAAASAALTIGASGAWWVQVQRYSLQIEKLEHQQTSAELAGMRQTARDIAGFQKGFNDALANFQIAGQRNFEAQQGLDRRLRDLRSFTAGMRGDFSDLPDRIARAAQPALTEYATTCTAVFESMAAAGGRLAESGAGIARKAEGHAADAQLILDAWPKTPTVEGKTILNEKEN